MPLLVIAGCLGSPGTLAPCDPQSVDRPICHLTNPEDLGFLKDRSWIIVSEMAPNQGAADENDALPERGSLTARFSWAHSSATRSCVFLAPTDRVVTSREDCAAIEYALRAIFCAPSALGHASRALLPEEFVMSIDLVINAPKTPARLASIASMQLAMAGDAEGWLDLFAEDAVLQDPYGVSPMDPTGRGRVGKEEIAKFCGVFIKPDNIRFEIRQTVTSGHACVNIGTIFAKRPGGSVGWNEVVNVYEVDDAGKILLLRAYWDFDANLKTAF